MAEWRNGGMAEWWNGGMAEWRNGRKAEWRNGGMAEWHNVQYKIVQNQDTESTQMPPWRSPSWLVKKGMIIIKYINDCIIVSDSMKDINTSVKSMKDGPKGYVSTDEEGTNIFLELK